MDSFAQPNPIDELRFRGLDQIGIGAIRLYQETISKATPAKCRFQPTCSQYGIQAIEEWGLLEGIKLTRKRIAKCHRPNGGYDPVPTKQMLASSSQAIATEGQFSAIPSFTRPTSISDYEHSFKLILSYPVDREFLSKEDFTQKIAEFNRSVLQIPQYTLLFKVNEVEVGKVDGFYLLRFSGTTSGEYLETSVDEVIELLTAQLEGFFLVANQREFKPLYFEVDGQTVIEPEPKQEAVPSNYSGDLNFWTYTSDRSIWDEYWDSYLVESLIDLLVDVTPDLIDMSLDASDTDGCDLLDGCDIGEGCDINPFDGDGCELGDGCSTDGCDVLDGCDGCDLDGCDLDPRS